MKTSNFKPATKEQLHQFTLAAIGNTARKYNAQSVVTTREDGTIVINVPAPFESCFHLMARRITKDFSLIADYTIIITNDTITLTK